MSISLFVSVVFGGAQLLQTSLYRHEGQLVSIKANLHDLSSSGVDAENGRDKSLSFFLLDCEPLFFPFDRTLFYTSSLNPCNSKERLTPECAVV